jgi:hypothetical protein
MEFKVQIHYPDGFKMWGLTIDTNDKKLYQIFNIACSTKLKPHHGFHQSGSDDDCGYSFWELWTEQDAQSMRIIKSLVKIEMERVSRERFW